MYKKILLIVISVANLYVLDAYASLPSRNLSNTNQIADRGNASASVRVGGFGNYGRTYGYQNYGNYGNWRGYDRSYLYDNVDPYTYYYNQPNTGYSGDQYYDDGATYFRGGTQNYNNNFQWPQYTIESRKK